MSNHLDTESEMLRDHLDKELDNSENLTLKQETTSHMNQTETNHTNASNHEHPVNTKNNSAPESVDTVRSPPSNETSPNNPSWNSYSGVAFWVVSTLLILIIPSFAVIAYLIKAGVSLTDKEAMMAAATTDSNVILVNIAAIIPVHLITIGLAWLLVTRINKDSFKQVLGWKWGGFTWWHSLSLMLFFYGMAAGLSYLFGKEENPLINMLQSSRSVVYLVVIMATFTAPLIEEVVYRGILYSPIQRRWGAPAAVIIITFLFALVHVPQYYPSIASILAVGILSLSLTLVRAYTNNLLPCIVLHMIFNGSQSILILFESFYGNNFK